MELGGQSMFSLPSGLDVSVVTPAAVDALFSQAELRHTSRQRKYNFSFREKELLVTLIERHGDVVESRTGDGVTIEQKMHAWHDIETRFNEMNGASQLRSVSELKKCYWNLKQKTKKALEAEREVGGTMRVDRVLWRIAQLAPEQYDGLLDMHCEVVDTANESDITVKEEGADSSDLETPRVESPGQSQASPASDLDMYPIPSDYLSVEMSAPPPCPPPAALPLSAFPRVRAPPLPPLPLQLPPTALFPPRLPPGLQLLNGGHGVPSALRERLGDALEIQSVQNGFVGGQKRAASELPRGGLMDASELPRGGLLDASELPRGGLMDAPALELRRLEHEYRMRLLRQEADNMSARHRLEMEVLEQQRIFWREALKRARCANDNPQYVL